MRGLLLSLILGGLFVGSLAVAPRVAADPDPDFDRAKHFDLDCGAAGTFDVVFVESHLGTFHVLGDSTRIFQSTSLTIEGELIFATPGFDANGRDLLTCTFIGAATGRHFTVTGFFTPARGSDPPGGSASARSVRNRHPTAPEWTSRTTSAGKPSPKADL